jgi:DNA-binding IclR family transcriptional regulator
VLKRRGYVQQDDDTSRYRLSLKMLDLSVRLLGRSELRLHAYPALREVVLRTGWRAFLATAADGEVTYVWSAGPDDVAMHTTYGRAMPGHCAVYYGPESTRRLMCLRLESRGAAAGSPIEPRRLGAFPSTGPERAGQHLACTCAPVIDYAGREVARVGLFAHDLPDATLARSCRAEAGELARLISLRLGGTLAPPAVQPPFSPVDPT